MRLLAILLVLLPYCSIAQTAGFGSIRGTVMSEITGEPLPMAVVGVVDTGLYIHCDANGNYSFDAISAGTHTLYVSSSGYQTDTIRNIVVKADQVTYVNLQIKESGKFAPPNVDQPAFNKKTAIIVGSLEAMVAGGTLIGLHQLWYKQYPRESFHTFNDASEWCQMDKLGHFQSSYSIASIATRSWAPSHMNYRKATWIGGLTSFAYLTTIEIMDGYSTGWGFSVGDMITNTAGSALFISQQLLFRKQIVLPKFGFTPSPYAELRPEILGEKFSEELLKDYNGQTYWLSVNMASFMKSDTKFPRWLNVAFGYGANGMTGGHQNPVMYNSAGNVVTVERYRQFYLSLDIDLRRIPTRSPVLRFILDTINFIKIPAPALEVNKFGVRGHVFMF